MGFDCTIPFGKRNSLEWGVPVAPVMPKGNGGVKKSVADTLAAGPANFLELMVAASTRDGREIVRELDALYSAERLTRNDTGRYVLKGK
jgi:hypothetical protein